MTDHTPNLTPVALAPFLPLINGDALIGAFCGAILYVASSPESSMLKRIVYMCVSIVTGYSFAPALTPLWGINHAGVPAFLISGFIVMTFFMIVDKIKTGEIIEMIRGKK